MHGLGWPALNAGAPLPPHAMGSAAVNSFEWSFELIGLAFIALCLCVFVFSSRLPPDGSYRDVR